MSLRARVAKLLRYATVSAISSAVSLTILAALVASGATTAGWANVIATAVGTVPSFELNRRWVWGKKGRRSAWAEVGPYCALAFAGLAFSTLAVSMASRWATASGWGVEGRTLAADTANIATFGTLWVFQYQIADRVLFKGPRGRVGAAGDEVVVARDCITQTRARGSLAEPGVGVAMAGTEPPC